MCPQGTNLALTLQQKYEEVTKTNLVLKNENRRVNSYLNQILKEVEEKAPIFQEQQEVYEQMQVEYKKMSQVSGPLFFCEPVVFYLTCYGHIQKLEKALSELDAAEGKSELLAKENCELSKQVQQLLAGTSLVGWILPSCKTFPSPLIPDVPQHAECMQNAGYPPRPAPPSSVSSFSLENTENILPPELVTFKYGATAPVGHNT